MQTPLAGLTSKPLLFRECRTVSWGDAGVNSLDSQVFLDQALVTAGGRNTDACCCSGVICTRITETTRAEVSGSASLVQDWRED